MKEFRIQVFAVIAVSLLLYGCTGEDLGVPSSSAPSSSVPLRAGKAVGRVASLQDPRCVRCKDLAPEEFLLLDEVTAADATLGAIVVVHLPSGTKASDFRTGSRVTVSLKGSVEASYPPVVGASSIEPA